MEEKLRYTMIENLTEPIFKRSLFNWTMGKMDPYDNYGSRMMGKAVPMPKKKKECWKGWCGKCKDVHEDVDLRGGNVMNNDYFTIIYSPYLRYCIYAYIPE